MKDLCRGYILVVEEDHDLGRLFEAVLAIDGYHVTVTPHIYEAHRILSQREPT
jgi:DNA-binding response OmpR family regulator